MPYDIANLHNCPIPIHGVSELRQAVSSASPFCWIIFPFNHYRQVKLFAIKFLIWWWEALETGRRSKYLIFILLKCRSIRCLLNKHEGGA